MTVFMTLFQIELEVGGGVQHDQHNLDHENEVDEQIDNSNNTN